ncbi:6832_t:CDS:1, partial [Funneliformis geosporum]
MLGTDIKYGISKVSIPKEVLAAKAWNRREGLQKSQRINCRHQCLEQTRTVASHQETHNFTANAWNRHEVLHLQ